MAQNTPFPLFFGTGPNTVAQGNDPRFGSEGTWDADITAAVQGDLSVAWTNKSGIWERRNRKIEIFATLQFTLNYTATAWAASTVYAVGNRRTNGGNVYEALTAGTSAASGGPTGTGASIADGTNGLTWKYISVATSGVMTIGGLPLPNDPTGPKSVLPCLIENLIAYSNNGTNTYFVTKPGTNTGSIIAPKTGGTPQQSVVSASQFGPGVLFTVSFNGAYRIAANL